ncbi:MAG: HAMP domain-containing sensor histidine kinase [Myxococcaceae bacterium]
MHKLRHWLASRLDVIAFAAALASVGPLMGWWAVLVRRTILSSAALLRAEAMSLPEAARVARFAELDAQTERQLFMITGESAMAGALVVVLAVVLFAVARKRRSESIRLETMLQLTTHQLKTPLAGVRTLLQSLENGAIPKELQAKFLSQGLAECDRLEHMVETTLAYQRSVSRQRPVTEAAPARELVGEIVEHRRATFPQEEVQLDQVDASVVRCDRDAVRVVLENLLDNARKYGGGKVSLRAAAKSQRWELEVRDQGQGFEPKDRERLFQPFERGGGPGVLHGSGLGLYLSRQLARRMGGELSASSEGPGRGACFVLSLPLATEVAHG